MLLIRILAKGLFLAIVLLDFVNCGPGFAQTVAVSNIVAYKNYYLLTLLEQDKRIKTVLESDTLLQKIALKKYEHLNSALQGQDLKATITSIGFSETQVETFRFVLGQMYDRLPVLQKLVIEKLIPSGCYQLYCQLTPKQQLLQACVLDMEGITRALNIYALGQKSNYPDIDSISFKVQAIGYIDTVKSIIQFARQKCSKSRLFFKLPMQCALAFLKANGRLDAANYEPMERMVNKSAVQKAKRVKWNNYRYTALLVPGEGPEHSDIVIDPLGKMRCRLAAGYYRQKLSPFIIVSGGKVHPYKTPFCEAEEMKRYLIDSLKIPASAVIMEPYARHTTTNMRNAARLMIRYGLPLTQPGLVICEKDDEDYIMQMNKRCVNELGYVPYRLGKRINDTELEFFPLREALQINSTEPLDP